MHERGEFLIKNTTVMKALKSCFTTHNKPRMIQSIMAASFRVDNLSSFLLKYNIEHKFWPPYRPK